MLRNPNFVTIFASGYLLVYCLSLGVGNIGWQELASVLLLFSPLMMVWLTYTVIRYSNYDSKDLKEDEEYGYCDRDKNSLGIW